MLSMLLMLLLLLLLLMLLLLRIGIELGLLAMIVRVLVARFCNDFVDVLLLLCTEC